MAVGDSFPAAAFQRRTLGYFLSKLRQPPKLVRIMMRFSGGSEVRMKRIAPALGLVTSLAAQESRTVI
jgi:hypothetical protein